MASYEMIDVLQRLRELDEKNPNIVTDAVDNTEKFNPPVEEAKKAKPDFLDVDKDGDKKEPMKKAVKDKEKKKVDESITISADSPEDLPIIAQIMKLAGMQPVTPDMMPDQDNTPVMKAEPSCGTPTYDNTPQEQVKGIEDVTTQTGYGDTNGPKHPQDIRVKDPSPFADYEQRLAKLAGIEKEEVEDEVTDQETEEGYANSMGNEKEDPTYKGYDPDYSDHTEDGKPKVRYVPSRYGDNPLESIEQNLMKEYTDYVKERELSKAEEKTKEKYVKGMKKEKGDFKKRYGDDAEAVMYATATKMAKKA
jgi:hypothetical protein